MWETAQLAQAPWRRGLSRIPYRSAGSSGGYSASDAASCQRTLGDSRWWFKYMVPATQVDGPDGALSTWLWPGPPVCYGIHGQKISLPHSFTLPFV